MESRLSAQHRLTAVWTWLPAFRAVAEVEHVQRAALMLHVTPSSLSRAIGLLEGQLGHLLFDRVGRNIRLNHDGEELLAAVREGMRRIDEGMAQITSTSFAGEIRVACEGDQPMTFAWRAASRLRKKYSELRTTIIQSKGRRTIAARLLRGELDIAIVSVPPHDANLLVEHLGDVTYGIYCAVGHPLYKQRKPSMKMITRFPFVAPAVLDEDGPADQWPGSIERIISLRIPALEPAIAACASGELLAVLPDIAALESSTRRQLRRLPNDAVPSSPIYAARRRPMTERLDRAGAFVAELRAQVGKHSKSKRPSPPKR